VRVAVDLDGANLIWAELREEEAAGLSIGDSVAVTWPENAALVLGEGGA
jgi:uncharacterized OB-fold protein